MADTTQGRHSSGRVFFPRHHLAIVLCLLEHCACVITTTASTEPGPHFRWSPQELLSPMGMTGFCFKVGSSRSVVFSSLAGLPRAGCGSSPRTTVFTMERVLQNCSRVANMTHHIALGVGSPVEKAIPTQKGTTSLQRPLAPSEGLFVNANVGVKLTPPPP